MALYVIVLKACRQQIKNVLCKVSDRFISLVILLTRFLIVRKDHKGTKIL
jgi:hypothetical protein